MDSVFDELDEVFGPSVIRDVYAVSDAIGGLAVAADNLRKAITMRRSELLMLHAAEIGGVTLRNYERALRRSRRNQGRKR